MLNVNALGLPFKPLVCNHPAPVTDGCVLYLDGRYGGNDPATQTWYDLSGNGNDGALTNFAYNHIFSGWTGQGLAFDGVDDYVDCGNRESLNISGAITLSAWIKIPTTNGKVNKGIVSKYESVKPVNQRSYALHIDWQTTEHRPRIGMSISSDGTYEGINDVAGNTVLSADTWYHVVGVYIPGESLVVYLNGVQDGINTTNIMESLFISSASCKIGYQYSYSPNTLFNGTIHNVRIYNRALSDREITQNYLATKCIMPLRHIDNAVTPAELLQNEIAAKNSPLFHDHYNTAGAEWTAAPLTQMVRLGTTANKTAGSDFDSIYPWSEMKLCNVNDSGEITAYIGDDGFKRDGTNGQVMVKIPKFYYRHVYGEAAKKHQFWVSEHPISGFKLHPAFIRAGVEKDYVLIGAYEAWIDGGGKLASISGVEPTTNKNIGDFRAAAQERGTGWSQLDIQTTSAVQLLYLVEYANTNCQTAIGSGVVDKGWTEGEYKAETTGGCDGKNGVSGVGNNNTVSYRGIENLWGNVWAFVDGINITERRPYVADHDFASDNFNAPYTDAGFELSSTSGYVKDFACSAKADWLLMPTTVGGGSSTYIPDHYYQNWGNSADKVALVGGYWNGGTHAGLFRWAVHNVSSDAHLTVGARLLLIP